MKVKPILLVKVPYHLHPEMMCDMRGSILRAVNGEYHVLMILSYSLSEVDVSVLNADELTPLQYEQLEALVKGEVEKTNQPS